MTDHTAEVIDLDKYRQFKIRHREAMARLSPEQVDAGLQRIMRSIFGSETAAVHNTPRSTRDDS